MRFSVIIPLFNKAPYIAKAIGSVLEQTFSDFELIVVDDGSTDGSADIAWQVLEGATTKYRIIRQENAGVSLARNAGVAASRGAYLCFLDADDWWDPAFLMDISRLIEAFPNAGIYGTNYTIVNETKHKTRIAPIGVEPGFEKGYINYYQVYAKTLAMPLWTGSICIPRPVFEKVMGFPEGIRLGEDFLLWLKIAQKYKVAFLNKPLAFYNQDVEMVHRGVVKSGYEPDSFMTFHFDQFEAEEKENHDLKVLLDRIRVYSLMRFRLSHSFNERVKKEIEKVNFVNVDKKYWLYYKMPYPLILVFHNLEIMASKIKRIIK